MLRSDKFSHNTGGRPALHAEWCLRTLLVMLLLPLAPASAAIPASIPRPAALPGAAANPAAYDTTASLVFEHLSLENGLSQNSIYCLLQDHLGFLWIGTQDGLNRYDGYRFEIYRPHPGDADSLSHHFIRALYEDEQGALWIGTDGGGLNRLDRQTGRIAHYHYNPADPQSLSGERVYALYGDRQGRLWVGTNNGLNRFDPDTGGFVRFQGNDQASTPATDSGSLMPAAVHAILQDQAGRLWIGSDGGGLARLDPDSGQVDYYRHDAADPASLSDNTVLAIVEAEDGGLWLGTGGGLDRLDPATGRFQHYRHDPADAQSLSSDEVSSLYLDRAGTLWAGTMGGGLNRLDRNTGQFTRFQAVASGPSTRSTSLSRDFVGALLEDRSGILWVGTLGGGLDYAGCGSRPFTLYQSRLETQSSLSEDVIWSITEDGAGDLWVGTFGGGLNRLNRSSGQWTHYRHDPDDPHSLGHDVVRAVLQDRDGVLWVGTEGGGLDRLDPISGQFTHYRHDPADATSLSHDGILTLYLDARDELWIGTWNGLNRLDRATGGFVRYLHNPLDPTTLSHSTVRAIYQDRAGALWVGTSNGLNRLDRDTGRFQRYLADPQDPGSLSSADVLSIYEDRAGTLWVGTFGGGLNRLDRETGTFTHYGEQEGLPSPIVYGILEEASTLGSLPGLLWLSTNGGLSRFDPTCGLFVTYDVRDGLQSNEFNAGAYFRSPSGEMFFGGVNGFNSFYPSNVRSNSYVPPVVLTALLPGGSGLPDAAPADSLSAATLRWPNNDFEFEFAALSYCQPERNQYAYRLESFDRAWIQAGTQRQGRYTNLPGGTYTLHIKGSNNDGLWNEAGLTLPITVIPPWWATWWFRGLAGLLLVGGVVAGFRLRVRAIQKQSRELERQVAERTAQLRHEMEQRFELEQALRQSEADKAVSEERNRLARDLHDSVTQSLYAVTLYADAATRLLSTGQAGPAETNLQKLRRTAREALGEMRLLIFELRPPILEQHGLAAALRARLEAVEGRAGVKTGLQVAGEGRLPLVVEEGLYRIAVEALNNALKHAHAHCITVSFTLEPGSACLEVADDGAGLDPEAAFSSGGLGLRSMSERAEQMGGHLLVDSRPGQGTCVRVTIDRGPASQPIQL